MFWISRLVFYSIPKVVLSAERLKRIAEAIRAKLPRVRTIAMYASIQNIHGKTDAELRQLRALGVNELNIGMESGLDAALKRMNKGHIAQESIDELLLSRLDLQNTYYFGLHPSNVLPMRGMLPRDKAAMIDAVKRLRRKMERCLNERPVRVGEGAIVNRQ